MSKTTVTYRDIAVGAAEAASIAAIGQTAESEVQRLAVGVPTRAIPTMEPNRWLLDGSFQPFYDEDSYGYWSDEISDETGAFTTDPVLTVSFSKQFSSMGISLIFDEQTGEYCSKIHLQWYQGDALKAEKTYYPNEVQYFCSNRIESYDKVVIIIQQTNLPIRRAKINKILFGVTRVFGMNELRDAAITNQMDESTLQLPSSTFTWTLDSIHPVDYMFQLKQPVEVRNGDNLLGVYYIDGSNRKSQTVYRVECKDALGVLDEKDFPGAVYLGGISAKTLLESLAQPFEVEYLDGVEDTTLTGVLLNGTNRSAIQQVLFAWGVCIATDAGETLRVFNLPNTTKEIEKDLTFTGATVKTSSIVTQVEVTAHTYTEAESGGVMVNGIRYNDEQQVFVVKNPDVIATDKVNVKTMKAATLISPDIGQETAQRIYDWYCKRDTISAKIVYDGERLGDRVRIYTPWDTLMEGHLQKMEISLSNTVVYRAEVVTKEGGQA